jgi:O-antigen/teichoic acid export membrane protein
MKKLPIQKLFSPAAFSLGSAFALQGFALLGFMLLARLLPMHEMGAWALWLTFAAIADMTRQGILQNGLVRFAAKEASAWGEWLSAGLVLNTVFAAALGLLLALFALVLGKTMDMPGLAALALWALPFSLLQGLGRFGEAVQIARSDFRGIFFANLINGGLQFSLMAFLFLKKNTPSLPLLLAFQAVGILAGMLFAYLYRRTYFQFSKYKKERVLELFQFGKYVAGTNFFSLLFQRLDTLLIGLFLTPAAVAVYNVATRLNSLLDLPLNGLSQAQYPGIAAAYLEERPMQAVYENNVRQLIYVQVPLTILLAIFAPFAVQLLAGKAYADAAPLLQLLAIAGLVKPWGRTFGMTLDAIGKPRLNFKMLLASISVNLVLNLSLLPLLGVTGAALATGLGVIITTAMGQFLLKKELAIRPFSFRWQ